MFLQSFFLFGIMKTKMLTSHSHSFPFLWNLRGQLGASLPYGMREGLGSSLPGRREPMCLTHSHSDTRAPTRDPQQSRKPVPGGRSSLSGWKVQFSTDSLFFLSPSSICSLINLSQLQSSPAMKEFDPKFYFSPSDALNLIEINLTAEDN